MKDTIIINGCTIKTSTADHCLRSGDFELRIYFKGAGLEVTDAPCTLEIEDLVDMRDCGDPFLLMKAKEYIVRNNEGLIGHMIQKASLSSFLQNHKEDLFQSGNIGLLKAFGKYSLGRSFATFARYYITHELIGYIESLTGTTSYYRKHSVMVQNAWNELEEKGEIPSTDAICKMTGLSRKLVIAEIGIINRKVVRYEDWMENEGLLAAWNR